LTLVLDNVSVSVAASTFGGVSFLYNVFNRW